MGAPGRIASQVILKDWSKVFKKTSRSNSAKNIFQLAPGTPCVSARRSRRFLGLAGREN